MNHELWITIDSDPEFAPKAKEINERVEAVAHEILFSSHSVQPVHIHGKPEIAYCGRFVANDYLPVLDGVHKLAHEWDLSHVYLVDGKPREIQATSLSVTGSL